MTEDDVDAAHALDVACFSLPWPVSAYHFEVSINPDSLPLVIESRGEQGEWRLAGLMVIWLILDEAHIGTIAIGVEYRRMGLARKLLGEGLLISHDKRGSSRLPGSAAREFGGAGTLSPIWIYNRRRPGALL